MFAISSYNININSSVTELKQDTKGLNPFRNEPSNFMCHSMKTLRVFVLVGVFFNHFYSPLPSFFGSQKVNSITNCGLLLSCAVDPVQQEMLMEYKKQFTRALLSGKLDLRDANKECAITND